MVCRLFTHMCCHETLHIEQLISDGRGLTVLTHALEELHLKPLVQAGHDERSSLGRNEGYKLLVCISYLVILYTVLFTYVKNMGNLKCLTPPYTWSEVIITLAATNFIILRQSFHLRRKDLA